ncbi:MAG: arginine--tRNA ligase, partial [Verrucomicrobiota bacterium]
MLIPERIRKSLQAALASCELDIPAEFQAEVTEAKNARFGDYQSNCAMALARVVKRNPAEIAGIVAAQFDGGHLIARPEIAGGYLNFKLTDEGLASMVAGYLTDERLGVPKADKSRTIAIDFSAPNVAKPMHVGHIRSTIIGDCLSRVAGFMGHEVITDNHIGDWGTQFGMIIYGWKNHLDEAALENDPIRELLRIYREVNAKAKVDEKILDTCRNELVKLQQGDEENHAIWKKTVELSLKGLNVIYDRLDVKFDHYLGESFYNDRLGPLVDDLVEKNLARESEGALCVFFPDEKGLEDHPAIVRKKDGGFNYTTSDLATIDYRCETWKTDAIWYVVGAPQQLHFKQIFAASRMRGVDANMAHIAHGSILGKDRKMMKTRSGDNVQLADVLDEAVGLALKVVEEKNPGLTPDEKEEISEVVGIGAVKFAELSQHRMTDYIFDAEKMLSFQGATAPYIQNAYVRTRSIFRKLGETPTFGDSMVLADPAERKLALKLLRFGELVHIVLG